MMVFRISTLLLPGCLKVVRLPGFDDVKDIKTGNIEDKDKIGCMKMN